MKLLFTTFLLFIFSFSFGQVQAIYTDFDDDFIESDLTFSGAIGNQFFFIKKNSHSTKQLMISNGTTQGTRILESGVSFNAAIFKSKVYYEKYNYNNHEIYATDGTTTTLLIDSINQNGILYATKDLMYFLKNDQVWQTDGTLVNTYAISHTFEGHIYFYEISAFLDKVYFRTRDKEWITDGDTLKPFDLVSDDETLYFNGVEMNGVYYTGGKNSVGDHELWRTDGTPEGTFLLKNLDPTSYQTYEGQKPSSERPRGFVRRNDEIFFLGNQGIWKTDGTSIGTTLIKSTDNYLDYYNGSASCGIINGKYFVEIWTFDYGNELWVSDGTTKGTQVLDIFSSSVHGYVNDSYRTNLIANFDNHLYFQGDNGLFGRELWRTDGTPNGTTIVEDINPGIKGNKFLRFGNTDEKLFFIAQTKSSKITTLYTFDKNAIPQTPNSDDAGIEFHKVIGKTRLYGPPNLYNQNLKTDKDGNIYVLGQFQSDVTLDFFRDTFLLLGDDRTFLSRNFIAKYSKQGELEWVNTAHGEYEEEQSIVIDNNNDVIVGGIVHDFAWCPDPQGQRFSFFGGNINFSNKVAYVVKFGENGQKKWSKFLDGTDEYIHDVGIDAQNQIYVLSQRKLMKLNESGKQVWAIDLDQSHVRAKSYLRLVDKFLYIVIPTYLNERYMYLNLMKYRLDGTMVWQRKVDNLFTINDFAISKDEQIAIIGNYFNEMTIPPFQISRPDNYASFQLRMDKNGNILQLINDSTSTQISNIIFDENQNYYTVSQKRNNPYSKYEGYDDRLDFPSNYTTLSVKKYNYQHNLTEERTFYTGVTTTNPKMVLTSDDKILLSGVFDERLDTLPFRMPYRYENIRLIKFALKEGVNPPPTWEITQNLTVSISPNPTSNVVNVRIIESNFMQYDLQIFNAKGQLMDYYEKRDIAEYSTYSLNQYQSGVYFFKFRSGKETFVQKVVVTK